MVMDLGEGIGVLVSVVRAASKKYGGWSWK